MQSPGPLSEIPFDDKPVIVRLAGGELIAFFFRSLEGVDAETARYSGYRVTTRSSTDHGRTWGDEKIVLTLPTNQGGFFRQDGLEALVDDQGEVHLFFLNDAKSGVVPALEKFVAVPGEDQRPAAGSMSKARLDIWHMRTTHQRTRWPRPAVIWKGYSGALNSVVQLRSGRIVLPFSHLTDRAWGGNRGAGPDEFTFRGQFDCTVVYSDDRGATWRNSPTPLTTPVPDIVSAYGAVEPVVQELRDGRVWMLIRTQNGRFYESFSPDGAAWSRPNPNHIISSDSPPALADLSDGRIVMFWNNSLRFPYAYGGRQIMHAAVSDDDGKTWRGYREVTRDPQRHLPPPRAGDHGTGYPFAVATGQDKVILSTGQGASKKDCLLIDPAWLCETKQSDDFSAGLEGWSVFGTRGAELAPHPDTAGRRVLALRKSDPVWPAAAVWNFPAGASGTLKMKVRADRGEAGLAPLRISLTDHFSVPADEEDDFHAMFNLAIGRDGALGANQRLVPGRWHTIEVEWDCLRKRSCELRLDGQVVRTILQGHATQGLSYLRIVALEPGQAVFCVESIEVQVSPPATALGSGAPK